MPTWPLPEVERLRQAYEQARALASQDFPAALAQAELAGECWRQSYLRATALALYIRSQVRRSVEHDPRRWRELVALVGECAAWDAVEGTARPDWWEGRWRRRG